MPGPAKSRLWLCRIPSPSRPPVHAQLRFSSTANLTLPPSSLSHHWETTPPTSSQLSHANTFFTTHAPTFLYSSPKFKHLPFGSPTTPEICFIGRSNVGKSSLLNALLGRNALAHTSSQPGRTKSMAAFSIGNTAPSSKGGLVLLDMPGYGHGGRAEWGVEILKYLEKREQLRRAFVLVDALHGVKDSDEQLLRMFRERGVPHQVVLSKVDRVLGMGRGATGAERMERGLAEVRRALEDVRAVVQPEDEEGGALGEVIACCAERKVGGQRVGIGEVRFAMLRAVGLDAAPEERERKEVRLGKAGGSEIVPHEQVVFRHGADVG